MDKRKPTNKEARAYAVPVAELLADLYATVERKCRRLEVHNPLGNRGTLCAQLYSNSNDTYLFIMEGGYRGTLYPRLVYKFAGGHPGTYEERLRQAIRAERKENTLVAKADSRHSVTILPFDYGLDARDIDQRFSKEVNLARAKRAVRHAEQDLELAKEWLTRAQEQNP